MDTLQFAAILLYILSSAGYIAHLLSQRDSWQRAACVVLFAGFLSHTAFILFSSIHAALFPGGNLNQALVLTGWAFTAVFLLIRYRFNLKVLGVYAAPVAAGIMILAVRVPDSVVTNTQFFKSFWVFFHVLTMFLGNGALALACGAGIMYLLQERAIKTKTPGFFFKRLPSLELLDTVGYGCLITGFTLLTLGLAAGFVYAKIAWGRFWSWDPKEVWAGIVWLFYAALLHERLTVGWRGRRAALMSIIGLAVILFTFFGVNLLLDGHHGEFTKW